LEGYAFQPFLFGRNLYFSSMKKQVLSVEEIKRKLEQYCVYQDRCHKEVEKKLSEYNLIPEAKEYILLNLLQHNFLNEERFAKSFARGKFRIKKWGKQRIVRELKFRDISQYNIKTALKEIDEQEYIGTLYELVEKKNESISESNIYKRKKKIIDFLRYRGWESNLIYEAVNEVVK
jgi:regulatory protein